METGNENRKTETMKTETMKTSIEDQIRNAEIDYRRFTSSPDTTDRSGTWVRLEIVRLKKLLEDTNDING